jgi:hypothetical protein
VSLPKGQRHHDPYRRRRAEVINLLGTHRFASKTRRRLATFTTIRRALTERGEADSRRRWTVLLNAFRNWSTRQG